MEGVSVSVLKGLKEYWKRRGYQRLNGSGRRRRRTCRVKLGSGRRRRFWRIKMAPRIRFTRIPSPKKMLLWLRDAYVRMMMRVANSRAMSFNMGCPVVGFGGGTPALGFGRGPLKEYDEKMIIQMYKSLMLRQAHLVPGDAPRISSVLAACSPKS
ncbi:uncharacterized protein LOC129287768 [Prosopis cineraria]|uniref:uncharacterized protein LOC129287768 n=1 Tax=Prosopis cineraria TaxID=364024 RepID=UPI00240F9192|nr:uncharacterized protein LOC129287768 [Prosopis cineraria]